MSKLNDPFLPFKFYFVYLFFQFSKRAFLNLFLFFLLLHHNFYRCCSNSMRFKISTCLLFLTIMYKINYLYLIHIAPVFIHCLHMCIGSPFSAENTQFHSHYAFPQIFIEGDTSWTLDPSMEVVNCKNWQTISLF